MMAQLAGRGSYIGTREVTRKPCASGIHLPISHTPSPPLPPPISLLPPSCSPHPLQTTKFKQQTHQLSTHTHSLPHYDGTHLYQVVFNLWQTRAHRLPPAPQNDLTIRVKHGATASRDLWGGFGGKIEESVKEWSEGLKSERREEGAATSSA